MELAELAPRARSSSSPPLGVGLRSRPVGRAREGLTIHHLDSRLGAVAPWLFAVAPWLFAAYLIVPPLFKASLQPLFPIDLTVLLAIPNAAIGCIWIFLERARLQRRHLIVLGLWLALAALVVLGVLWAPSSRLALYTAAYFTFLTTLPLLAAFPVAADEGRMRSFLLAFVVAGLIFVFFATVALFAGELGGRVIGTNRIGVARALLFVPLVGIPLLAWRRFGARGGIVLGVSSLAVVLAVATGSRAPALFFVVVGVVLTIGALALSRHRRRVLSLAGGLLLGTIVVFVSLSGILPQRSGDRFAGLVDAAEDALDDGPAAEPSPSGDGPGAQDPDPPSSIVQRALLYQFALELFVAHPVLGVGTSGFEVESRTEVGIEGRRYPHNLVLQVASEFGLVGLAMVGSLGLLAVLTWRPDSTVSVAVGALFAFILLGAMLSNGVYENRMLWGVWLLALLYRQPEQAVSESPDARER